MKRIKSIGILILITAFCCMYPVYTEDSVPKVYVNGEPITFSENEPMLINDRTMIPLREMFHIFRFDVSYHDDTRTIYLRNDEMKAFFRIGDLRFFIEQDNTIRYRDLDVAPVLQDSRTYIPLRAVAEVMGAEVKWDSETASVLITLK